LCKTQTWKRLLKNGSQATDFTHFQTRLIPKDKSRRNDGTITEKTGERDEPDPSPALACAALLAGTAGLASPALAGGFYLQDQSTKARAAPIRAKWPIRRGKPVVEPGQHRRDDRRRSRSAPLPSCTGDG
jgi:hypothetical protein